MIGFLSLLVFLFSDAAPVIELEIREALPIYNLKAEVARDGSLLFTTPRTIFHWDETGRLLQRLDKSDFGDAKNLFIATFAYDVRDGVYWVVDGTSRYSFFFDRNGRFLGKATAYYPGSEEPVFIRDLITVGGRVFAMDGIVFSSLWGRSKQGLFQQVAWVRGSSGPGIRLIGKSFGSPTPIQREYAYDFKRHWIIQDGFNKRFFVVNQLSTEVQIFTARGEDIDDGLEDTGQTIPLIMPGWRPTPSRTNGMPKPNPTQYHTLSQIKGFCPVGQDLLVAWSIPDPANPAKSPIGLQRFDKQGLLRGRPIQTNGVFLGVHDEKAYILEAPEEGADNPVYRVRLLSL